MPDPLIPDLINPAVDRQMAQQPAPIGPRPQAPRGMAPPSFSSTVLPMLVNALASRRHPAAIGQGMAAFVRGQRTKRAEMEQDAERARREQMETASFYSRVLEQAQQFDDPLEFEQWRAAIAPVAEVYGVPVASIPFNTARADKKKSDTQRTSARATIDQLRKVHGEAVDDPAWQAKHTATFNGQQVPVTTVYGLSEMPRVTDQQGLLVGPPPKKADLPTAGSFEDYVITYARDVAKKPVDQLTAADKEDAKKRFNQADDRPRITVNTGATQARMSARIDRVATSFNTQPIVKAFNEIQAQAETIKQLVRSPWSGPADMGLIFSFMKALDPTSVVREAEYTNAAQSGNIFAGWAARFNGALNPNGGFLSPQVKEDFLRTITTRLKVGAGQYNNLRKQYVAKVDRIAAGAPESGEEAIFDYESAFADATNPTQEAPSGPKIGERRMIEGQQGEWDGKGWKPVAPAPLPRPAFAPGH